jgi:uncharacterized SAM-binding protein YcdF (DUF218 family)
VLKRVFIIFWFIILIGTSLWFSRETLLRGAAGFWIVSDAISPADAIVVLGGGIDTRPFAAVEDYNKGLAPKVLVANVSLSRTEILGAQPSHTAVNRNVLLKLGVPEADIETFGTEVSSTYEEAEALREWAIRVHAKSIIVPIEMFASRRVRWTLTHTFASTGTSVQIQVITPDSRDYNQSNWWRSHSGLIAFQNEVIKYIYYRWVY